MTKRQLAQQLAVVAGFDNPEAALEQYPTPPELAAHLVHTADLQGDIEDRLVVDLGTGTGMLALGAALRGPKRVVGVDIDSDPLETAQRNQKRVGTASAISWVLGDATQAPICSSEPTTVLMNPPFGAQKGHEHADRAFLETVADIADVSYSVHNQGSQEFIEAFAADAGGEVTHAYEAQIDLPRQFEFHDEEVRELTVEVFRIAWD